AVRNVTNSSNAARASSPGRFGSRAKWSQTASRRTSPKACSRFGFRRRQRRRRPSTSDSPDSSSRGVAQSMNRNVFTMAAVFVAFTGGLVMSRVSDREKPLDDDFTVTTTELPEAAQARQTTTALVPGGLPDLSSVAERAIQASVNISSTQDVVVRDPFYQMFYGRNAVRSETSLGSGVFVSSDGYVVTNSHVVGSPRADIKVTLADNRELPARVVGIDPVSDLAVLKLEVKGGVTLPWGDSSKLRVAEWVIAIGNPFQFNQTVTVGVVSAQNRHDQLASYTDFIQHDAAINPGNSGGALVNSRGELVGINTMIAGDTGGYQGLSFAIPANVARRILDTLI